MLIGLDAQDGTFRRARRLGPAGLADVDVAPDGALWLTGTAESNPVVLAGRSEATNGRDPIVVRVDAAP